MKKVDTVGMDVIDRPDQHRYELVDDGRVVGFAEYRSVSGGDTLEFPHTVIDPSERGRGLGEMLVTGAMADVRRKGATVLPTCWFVAQWFDHHPDDADLLVHRRDAEVPGPDSVVNAQPDSSAVRTALWRALHVQIDPAPHVLVDEIGLAIAQPEPGWQQRRDMHPEGTAGHRLALVARTRFVEDLLAAEGIGQYVLLGAGLDTFAQRHGHDGVVVFEVDQPGPQAWKRQRLDALGFGVADHLRLVPVDFESDDDWWAELLSAGFDAAAPALVSSSGVSMYITKDATASTLARLALLAPGSIVAMTFMYRWTWWTRWTDRHSPELLAGRRPRVLRGSASTRPRRSRHWRPMPASWTSPASPRMNWQSRSSAISPTVGGHRAVKGSSSLARESDRGAVVQRELCRPGSPSSRSSVPVSSGDGRTADSERNGDRRPRPADVHGLRKVHRVDRGPHHSLRQVRRSHGHPSGGRPSGPSRFGRRARLDGARAGVDDSGRFR